MKRQALATPRDGRGHTALYLAVQNEQSVGATVAVRPKLLPWPELLVGNKSAVTIDESRHRLTMGDKCQDVRICGGVADGSSF